MELSFDAMSARSDQEDLEDEHSQRKLNRIKLKDDINLNMIRRGPVTRASVI